MTVTASSAGLMQEFADQCIDMARTILGHNLGAINSDGTVQPVEGEWARMDEPGHAALAIGEYYRATGSATLEKYDLVDLAARTITAQCFTEEEAENGLAYSSLGLLSWGPAKDRNAVWERLLDPTRERLDRRLLARTDYDNHMQAFNVAKAVARFSMGLSKKDETGKLIDRFIERIGERSSGGFVDDGDGSGIGGVFDIYGILGFIFIRQALQLHGNIHLRERKLPSLRTHAEKYLRLLPDFVREDGLGWTVGRGVGAYGQMHLISLILQAMRDGWIADEKCGQYFDLLRRLFQFFFMTYIDSEQGFLVINDPERGAYENHTTRIANFDAARYLCQWSRLAGSQKAPAAEAAPRSTPVRPNGRYVSFEKSNRREQGVFIYRDPASHLHVQIPLFGANGRGNSDTLAFPHCPGIFDWPVAQYLPIMLPELTIDGNPTVPSYYGKRCVAGLGLRNSFYFRYEQPDLITVDERILPNTGSVKVSWTFTGSKITSEFLYTVKNAVKMDRMRYVLAIGAPHSTYRLGNSLMMGPEGLRCEVIRDDFQAAWLSTDVVSNEPQYRTYYGNLHYLQVLERDHPLNLRPGQQYRLVVIFDPDISTADL